MKSILIRAPVLPGRLWATGIAAPALIDAIAGHVPITVIASLSGLPHVRSGRLRAYGVTSARRMTVAPDIPTIAEQGVAGYEAVQWFGLLAPAGTPRDIVTKLHAGITRALQDPEVKKRFLDDGAEITPSATPEDFGAKIRAELAKWTAGQHDEAPLESSMSGLQQAST